MVKQLSNSISTLIVRKKNDLHPFSNHYLFYADSAMKLTKPCYFTATERCNLTTIIIIEGHRNKARIATKTKFYHCQSIYIFFIIKEVKIS